MWAADYLTKLFLNSFTGSVCYFLHCRMGFELPCVRNKMMTDRHKLGGRFDIIYFCCSGWAPFVTHILRVFSLLGNPAELDSVGEFTKIEGRKQQCLVPRPYSGGIELNSPWKWSLIELNRA